jgi:hypothetical protein
MDSLMDTLYHIIHPTARWLHIVATTLLVGGTMFYELVVPIAIEDLRQEQQLTIFGRARWVFRWIVWTSAVVLIISGALSVWRMWHSYTTDYPFGYPQTRPWAYAHISLGIIGIAVALLLTVGRQPPAHPIRWMRVNLVILLAGIFAANISRHVRLTWREMIERSGDPTRISSVQPPADAATKPAPSTNP